MIFLVKKINEVGVVYWDSKIGKINDTIPEGLITCPTCGDRVTWSYVPFIKDDGSFEVTLENFQCKGTKGTIHYFEYENLTKDSQTYLEKITLKTFQCS